MVTLSGKWLQCMATHRKMNKSTSDFVDFINNTRKLSRTLSFHCQCKIVKSTATTSYFKSCKVAVACYEFLIFFLNQLKVCTTNLIYIIYF